MTGRMPPGERCAALSTAAREPLAGTAVRVEAGYLMVEDPGPWGRGGLTESALGPVGVQLDALAAAAGVKAMVFRPTGRTVSRGRRRVVAARHVGRREQVTFDVTDPVELLSLDLRAYAGDLTSIHPEALPVAGPMVFVCTHAKRDQCCAIEGRPVVADLATRYPGRVHECSHLGGHRFAPTALVLPLGAVYGRLSIAHARRAVELAIHDRVLPSALRGLSSLAAHEQAADVAVRLERSEDGIDAVRVATVRSDGRRHVVRVDVQGERWAATVETIPAEPAPLSCGQAPSSSTRQDVTGLRVA